MTPPKLKQGLARKNYSLKNMGINKKDLICPAISSKVTYSKPTKMHGSKLLRVKCLIQNQKLEPDSNFVINSASDFDSASESDSSSVLMNLDICIFFTLYLHSLKQTC